MTATILVVDDSPCIREPIAAALQLAGFQTMTAADGGEALVKIAASKPSLVLLDMDMPGVNGVDVLRKLPLEGRPPVIVLTASQDRATVLQARELGVRHFLLKSTFSLATLLDRVRQVLDEAVVIENPSQAMVTDGSVSAQRTLTACTPIIARDELLARVAAGCQIKALPTAVSDVIELCASSTANSTSIATAIRRDQAVSLKILKLANSSAYAAGRKVTSVDEAVIRIGIGAIRQAVLNIGIIDQFSASGKGLDPIAFWEHSIGCGIIAAEIERSLGGQAPDMLFTMGLLHDVGRSVMLEQLGAPYEELLESACNSGEPVEHLESRLLSITHAQIATEVLRTWNVPRNLVEPIACHHAPLPGIHEDLESLPRDAAVLRLADALCHALMIGSSGNSTFYPSVALCEKLGVKAKMLRQLVDQAPEQARDMKLVLLAANGMGNHSNAGDELRKQCFSTTRPLFVSSNPDLDVMGIAIRQLFGAPDSRHNVVLLSCETQGGMARLCDELRQAELKAGVKNLPAVCLAAEGVALNLGPNRRVIDLPLPIAATRLIEALNAAADAKQEVKRAG